MVLGLNWDPKEVTWVSVKTQGKSDVPNGMEAFPIFSQPVQEGLHLENLVQGVAMRKNIPDRGKGRSEDTEGRQCPG